MLKLILLFVTILSIIPIIVLIFVLRYVRKSMRQSLGELFPNINMFSTRLEGAGVWNGIQYRYIYSKGNRNKGAAFKVIVACPSSASFRFSKLWAIDRMFQRTGLSAVVKSGDTAFDDQFFVHSEHLELTRSIISIPQFRQAITHLYEIGFHQVELKNKELVASIIPFKFQKKLSIMQIEEVVSQLAVLKQHVPANTSDQTDPIRIQRQNRILAFVLPSTITILGSVALVFASIYFQPVEFGSLFVPSLTYSIPLLIAALWGCAQLLKGRTNSHRDWMIASAIVCGGFILAGFGILLFTNGWLDNSQIITHDLQIVEKYKRDSGKSIQYHVRVSSWRQDETSRGLNLSRRDYERIVPGESMMHIETKAGKWGQEWYVSYGLVPTKEH